MLLKLLVLYFALCCTLRPTFGAASKKKYKTLVFESVITSYNSNYSSKYAIQVNPERTTFNMIWQLLQDTPGDVWLRIAISRKDTKSGKFRSVVDNDVNLCTILGKDLRGINIMQIWIGNLMKYINFPKSCPFKEGKYSLNNFRVERESLPPFVGTGLYRINAIFHICSLNNSMLTSAILIVNVKDN